MLSRHTSCHALVTAILILIFPGMRNVAHSDDAVRHQCLDEGCCLEDVGCRICEHPESPWYKRLGRSGGWFDAEALLWWTTPGELPPLVTTSPAGTPQSSAGVIGEPGTEVLYGDSAVLDESRGGLRLRGGFYFDCLRQHSLDAEYFFLTDATSGFSAFSTGNPIIARPFVNATNSQNDAQFVAYPGLTEGGLNVRLNSSLRSFALRYSGILVREFDDEMECDCRNSESASRWGGVRIGYRYLNLDETLRIDEDFTSVPTAEQFTIVDQFDVDNRFHGLEFGVFGGWRRDRLELNASANLALGVNRQENRTFGRTQNSSGGGTTSSSGGILVQRTNSGETHENQFSVVPQFELKAAYRITPHWRASLAYSFLYWHEVLRAGDQVDSVVNPNLFPPEAVPFTGPLRPERRHLRSGYLAHGLSFGLNYRW